MKRVEWGGERREKREAEQGKATLGWWRADDGGDKRK